MKIGILCEGRYDVEATQILMKRIIDEVTGIANKIEFLVQPANGPIHGKIESSLYNFFTIERCTFAAIFTDTDKNVDACKKCKSKIEDTCGCNAYPPCALACITPHFEFWFTKEEDALKSIFGLAGDQNLPHERLAPKDRIKMMIAESKELDCSYSLTEINSLAAEKIHFSKLMSGNYKEFKLFYETIKSALSSIETK